MASGDRGEHNPSTDVISAAAVTLGGLAVLALALGSFQLILAILDLVVPGADPDSDDWLRLSAFLIYVALLGAVTWIVFVSDLPDLVKAAFSFIPYGVFYLALAGNLDAGLVPALLIGGLFFVGALTWLRRSGKPWIYCYALLLVSLIMLIISVVG